MLGVVLLKKEKYTVFIAEDEPLVLEYIAAKIHALSDAFEVIGTAADGESALTQILELSPNVVFTDIQMPRMSGTALAHELQLLRPETKVVILTGFAEFEYAREAIQYKVFDYMLKPFNQSDMTQLLAKLQITLDKETNSRAAAFSSMDNLSSEQVFDIVRDYLYANYGEKINLQTLSEQFKYSPEYLIKLFKKYAQTTPIRYLINIRIDAAARLLTETDLPIAIVGQQVGYADTFHFSKIFKQHKGISPSSYREDTK